MKILLASDSYKYQMSGVATIVISLAERFRKNGHEVKVLALSNDRNSYKDGDDYYISSFQAKIYPDARRSFVIKDKYLDELSEWNPDIIHIHTEFSARRLACLVANVNRTPCVMTLHTDYAKYIRPVLLHSRVLTQIVIKSMSAVLYSRAKVVTTPSEKAKNVSKQYIMFCPVVVVPNGIELSKFERDFPEEEKAELLEKIGVPNEGKVLVAVSRISREKHLDKLIDYMPTVLERDKDVKLIIVGDGPDLDNLKSLSEALGLSGSVFFTGRVASDVVYKYYKLGNAFVCASDFEMQSLAYMEAMACGLPLLCYDDESLRGMLDHGKNGFKFTDREEYVNFAMNILGDKQLQKSMSAMSSKMAQKYDTQNCAERMLELYSRVVERHKNKGNSFKSWVE